MTSRHDLTQSVADAASSPTVAKGVATLTTGVGFSTYFGYLEKGVGFAAALMGLVVTVAIYKKIGLEKKEAELRIMVLEKKLEEG